MKNSPKAFIAGWALVATACQVVSGLSDYEVKDSTGPASGGTAGTTHTAGGGASSGGGQGSGVAGSSGAGGRTGGSAGSETAGLGGEPSVVGGGPGDTGCPQGTADCGGVADDCETDIISDDANCGGCAHDCRGANCSAGVCTPEHIADAVSNPAFMQVNSMRVFWTTIPGVAPVPPVAAVESVALDGSTRRVHAIDDSPRGLVLGSLYLFWTDPDGRLYRSSYDGANNGNQTVVATSAGFSGSPFFYSGAIYWKTSAAIYKFLEAQTDTTPDPLVSGLDNPQDPSVRNGFVYFVNGSHLSRAPASGGPVVKVTSESFDLANGLVVDDTDVYVMQFGKFSRVKIADGAVKTFALAGSIPSWTVQDDAYVYFTNAAAGDVLRFSKQTEEIIVLVRNGGAQYGLAIDDTHAYWGDFEGKSIWRVPK